MPKEWTYYSRNPRELKRIVELDDIDQTYLLMCLKSSGISIEELSCESYVTSVLKFVKERIKYDINTSRCALTPAETLNAKCGVCLEFANLACTLINLKASMSCHVVVGYRRAEQVAAGPAHAWIQYGDHSFEPQTCNEVTITSTEYIWGFKYNSHEYVELSSEIANKILAHMATGCPF